EDGQIVSSLAESWDVSADGLIWKFKLRPNLRFQEIHACGDWTSPKGVSASDVVYSLSRSARNPASLYRWALSDIVAKDATDGSLALRALDSHTVEIRLARPFPLLNRLVTVAGWVYPAEIAENCGEEFLTRTVVGTGPYRVVEHVPDDHVNLFRFDDSWSAPGNDAPARVEVSIQPDPVAALEGFKAGRFDIIETPLGTTGSARQLAASGEARHVVVETNSLDYLVLNNSQPPFNDVRVRQAINLAIDREALAKLLPDAVTPARGYLPPGASAWDAGGSDTTLKLVFDPDKARALMTEYTAEQPQTALSLNLIIDGGELTESIAQFIQTEIQTHLGLSVKINKRTWPEVLQLAFSGEGRFYRFWWNIVTPGNDLYFLFYFPGAEPPNGFNLSFYENSAFPGRYSKTFADLNSGSRARKVLDLQADLIRDAVAVPLFHHRQHYLVRNG
ncbi:MAG: ABC transporter substrate-binding protein, partial [Candidatus Thiodiazotropha sp.]